MPAGSAGALGALEQLRRGELDLANAKDASARRASWARASSAIQEFGIDENASSTVNTMACRLVRRALQLEFLQLEAECLGFIGAAAPALDASALEAALDRITALVSSAAADMETDKPLLKQATWALGCLAAREAAREAACLETGRAGAALAALRSAADNAAGSALAKFEAVVAFRRALGTAASGKAEAARRWATALLRLMLSDLEKLRGEAGEALAEARAHLRLPSADLAAEVAAGGGAEALVAGIGRLAGSDCGAAVAAWEAAAALLGARLLQPDLCNPMLALIGKAFGKGAPASRAAAYRAWRHVAEAIAAGTPDGAGSLARPKYAATLLKPLLHGRPPRPAGSLNGEEAAPVRKECLETWRHVLALAPAEAPAGPPLVEPVVAALLGPARASLAPTAWRDLAALLAGPRPLLHPALQPAPLLPRLLHAAPRAHSSPVRPALCSLFHVPRPPPEGDRQEGPAAYAHAWAALVARCTPHARGEARTQGVRAVLRAFADHLGPLAAAAAAAASEQGAVPALVSTLEQCYAAICERLGPADLCSAALRVPLDPPPAEGESGGSQGGGGVPPGAFLAVHWMRALPAASSSLERCLALCGALSTQGPLLLRAAEADAHAEAAAGGAGGLGRPAWRALARLARRALAPAPAPPRPRRRPPGPAAHLSPRSCGPFVTELLLYPLRSALSAPCVADASRTWMADLAAWRGLFEAVYDTFADSLRNPHEPIENWARDLYPLLPREPSDPSALPVEARQLLLGALTIAADNADPDRSDARRPFTPPWRGRRGRRGSSGSASASSWPCSPPASPSPPPAPRPKARPRPRPAPAPAPRSAADGAGRAGGEAGAGQGAARRFLEAVGKLLGRLGSAAHAQRAALELARSFPGISRPGPATAASPEAPTQTTQPSAPAASQPRPDDPREAIHSRLEKVWGECLGALRRCCGAGGWGDPDLLRTVAPTLMAGFASRRRGIRAATLDFWRQTFAKERRLEYPSSLITCLSRVRARTAIHLPSWPEDAPEEPAGSQETPPASQEIEEEEVVGRRRGPAFPVPPQLLRPRASPSPPPAPAPADSPKPAKRRPPTAAGLPGPSPLKRPARETFQRVVSVPKPPPPELLTERQLERLGRRPDLPPTYSRLDASQCLEAPEPEPAPHEPAPEAAEPAAGAGEGEESTPRGPGEPAGFPATGPRSILKRCPPPEEGPEAEAGPSPPAKARRVCFEGAEASSPPLAGEKGDGGPAPATAAGRRACNKIPRSPSPGAPPAAGGRPADPSPPSPPPRRQWRPPQRASRPVPRPRPRPSPVEPLTRGAGELAALQARAARLAATLAGALCRRLEGAGPAPAELAGPSS
eukprot:tig00000792_g4153.t1